MMWWLRRYTIRRDRRHRRGNVGAAREVVILVVIPVLNRPERVEPLLTSLYASVRDVETAPPVRRQTPAISRSRRPYRRPTPTGCSCRFHVETVADARKCNRAATHAHATGHEWVFLDADDLCFCHGGPTRRSRSRVWTNAQVVGTNDLGNPKVMTGEQATHSLVRTTYIETRHDRRTRQLAARGVRAQLGRQRVRRHSPVARRVRVRRLIVGETSAPVVGEGERRRHLPVSAWSDAPPTTNCSGRANGCGDERVDHHRLPRLRSSGPTSRGRGRSRRRSARAKASRRSSDYDNTAPCRRLATRGPPERRARGCCSSTPTTSWRPATSMRCRPSRL